jgi:hypothetical protein
VTGRRQASEAERRFPWRGDAPRARLLPPELDLEAGRREAMVKIGVPTAPEVEDFLPRNIERFAGGAA